MNLLRVVPAALLLAMPAAALTLEQGWVAETYTVEDGLPLNAITDMTWSRDGYLWLTTFDGLARFDGARFTTFTSATDQGIPSNRLTRIEEDDGGWLWIATEQNQLVRRSPDGVFKTVTGTPELPSELVHCLERDPRGRLWVCGDGAIGRIAAGRIAPVVPMGDRKPLALLRTRDETLWIGSEDGVVRLAPEPETWRTPRVRSLVESSTGEVLAGTIDGLWRLKDEGRIERVQGTEQLHVHRLEEHDGTIWMTTNDGLMRWSGSSVETVVRDGFSSKHRLSITTSLGRWVHSVFDLLLDGKRILRTDGAISTAVSGPEDNLWVATTRGLIRLRRSLFHTVGGERGVRSLYPVVIDRDGAILAGTLDQGWMRFDPVADELEIHDAPTMARTIVRDADGALWIGGDGLCRMQGRECRSDEIPLRLRQSTVLALALDSTGALWAGALTGLFRRSPDGQWRQVSEAGTGEGNVVRTIAESSDGTLWMGTAGHGLLRLHGSTVRRFTIEEGLPSNSIRSLLVDPDGSLWIGTENLGLAQARLHENGSLIVTSIRRRDGLFDNNINQILDDGMGRFWISSNRGMFWVARRDLEGFVSGARTAVRSLGYTEHHGMPNRETNGGVQSPGAIDPVGRLWFPTQAGLVGIDPATIPFTRDPPPVRLETLTTPSRTIPARGEIRLAASERNFEITYAALAFTSPESVRFRYRLAGLDSGWHEARDRRTAVYTRVPPGEYQFQVIASREGETWSAPRDELDLVVVPRTWEKGWFRIGALLLLLSLIPVGSIVRTRRLVERQHELEKKVAERTRELEEQKKIVEDRAAALAEVDRLKSRFFADVSHELRTPLTMIIGPVTDILEEPDADPESMRREIGIVRRNSLRLLRLVNQILDLHRLEVSGIELDLRTGDLVPVLEWLTGTFAPLADRCGVSISFEGAETAAPVRFDREQMEKIIGNLLSNAIKFTPMGGRVSVEVSEEESEIVVAVSDTGPGIPPEELDHVFERYVRLRSDAPLQQGSGLGLALARQLTELHGGRIEVESRFGEGSTFRVHLPRSDEPVGVGAPAPTRGGLQTPASDGEVVEPLPRPPALDGIVDPDTLILVVDDDDDVRRYVAGVLETEHRVLTARDGAEGFALAQEHLPDLIVSDVMMPVLDGFQLVRALRSDPMTEPVPVILLTARASETDEIEGLGTGADDYLPKPFSSKVLRARVSAILGRRRMLLARLRAEAAVPPELPPADTFEGRVHRAIQEQLDDDAFTADRLAETLGMSRSALERMAREECGTTPAELVRNARLERAAALLEEGWGSVSEIAYATGFRGLAQFSRAFKARHGVAPSQWGRG